MQVARDLLAAVADSDERSTMLAERLVYEILGSEVVNAAMALRELLRTRSPFALMRAVELVEAVCASPQPALRRTGHLP